MSRTLIWFRKVFVPAILAGSVVVSRTATVPPHEKLLPPDTVAMFTVFDWPKANASLENSAAGQLWRDAAMKPFRENFLRNVQSDTFPPFDSKWDIKISNYLALAQGQLTIALTQNGGDGLSTNPSAILFLMDAPDKIPQRRNPPAQAPANSAGSPVQERGLAQ